MGTVITWMERLLRKWVQKANQIYHPTSNVIVGMKEMTEESSYECTNQIFYPYFSMGQKTSPSKRNIKADCKSMK